MTKYLAAYAGIALLMTALDVLWIGFLAKPLYQQGIGHLMAEHPNMAAAAMFYAVYAVGLLVFAVIPNASTPGWGPVLLYGALFGVFAYATYDLTNLATLKGWPLGLSLIDISWGSLISAASAAAGKAAFMRFNPG